MTNASRRSRSALIATLLLWSSPARAEQRNDAELTWLFESGRLAGGASADARAPVWEHAAGRVTGRENSLRVRVSRVDSGLWRGLRSAAELRFEVLPGLEAATAPRLRDLSSFIAVALEASRTSRVELRVFPFDTDYLRLGFLHALDWGGTDRERHESIFVQQTGGAPGLELSWRAPRLRLFSALKWASVSQPLIGDQRLWGVLAGGSVDAARELRVDSGFGYFQRPSAGEGRGFVEGASLRVVWHRGPAEPELAAEPLRPAPLRSEVSSFVADATPGAAVALEAVTLVSRLRRFEDVRARLLSAAPAAAFTASLRGRALAAHVALIWRSLAFAARDDARVASDETLPADAAQLPELSAWLGGSAAARFGLVGALELGVELPAALQTRSQLPGYAQTFVLGGTGGIEPLPTGAGRLPVLAARASVRQPFTGAVTAALWLDYQRDANLSELATSSKGVIRRFAPADRLELGLAVQARF